MQELESRLLLAMGSLVEHEFSQAVSNQKLGFSNRILAEASLHCDDVDSCKTWTKTQGI